MYINRSWIWILWGKVPFCFVVCTSERGKSCFLKGLQVWWWQKKINNKAILLSPCPHSVVKEADYQKKTESAPSNQVRGKLELWQSCLHQRCEQQESVPLNTQISAPYSTSLLTEISGPIVISLTLYGNMCSTWEWEYSCTGNARLHSDLASLSPLCWLLTSTLLLWETE